ncbi:bacteriohemerythrin [Azospirillum isscasi]|uniref:Hemerythrin family protein n=1 Tax=Azospirillum isscasi TaxID=3053926 RepID=A0ABU0WI12_9PROT|nr:hemerythrin family protein [Azospirillum isscasi]MDQ2103673.1 hemerythrin family protein [Azospirillum isscasi]
MDMPVENFQDIVWSDDLALGIELIDEQHKHWIGLVHAFQTAVAEGRSRAEVYRTLAEAVVYTEIHFAEEQKVMETAGYPFLADHLIQHSLAWEQLHAFTTGNVPEENIAEYLATFLPQWLMLHINSADRQFARWLKERDDAPAELADAQLSGRVFPNIPV